MVPPVDFLVFKGYCLNKAFWSRFVSSAIPPSFFWLKNEVYKTNKFERKCLQKFYVSSKQEKECYMTDEVLPRGTESPFLSALHAKNDTTKLFFSFQLRKQFKLLAVPFKSLRHVWIFYKDLFLRYQPPLKLPFFHISGFNVFK